MVRQADNAQLNVMNKGLRGGNVELSYQPVPGGPYMYVLDEEGRKVEVTAATPEVFGLREVVARVSCHGQDATVVIDPMNGAALSTTSSIFAAGTSRSPTR
jgi:hypothetical protein